VHFVTDHVLESLIVCWTQEDQYFKLLASKPIVHNFITVSLVAQSMQISSNLVHVLEAEGCCISELSVQSATL